MFLRGVRPFAMSLLIAGFHELGPSLYQVDPSGSHSAWKASAIGKNMINAKTFLEKRYSETMELEDAVHTAILTSKEGYECTMAESGMEHTTTKEGDKIQQGCFKQLSEPEIKDYLLMIEWYTSVELRWSVITLLICWKETSGNKGGARAGSWEQ
ncbi:hypothetical protein CcCBS67573_g08610 [Chytriomyces confervae]|uniref:Proteasome endopeptidase complex n=1 Tax=Chytriomyces confervae TaxID=246404 RepID=A0A507EHI1_9FUNG|nr:hypothetical protein HDU80_002214 [Chytriomyces hyalinus]TPX63699.1 hypothetical protein CcCBS67573_g08610 [Chytriomyces confervae]